MCCGNSILQKGLPFFYLHKIFYTLFLKFSLDIFYDIFYGESFGDSISFERTMLLTLFICMGIHIYKNMENHPIQGGFSSYVLFT